MTMRYRKSQARSGAAMTEFALVLPVLIFLLVAAVDFARVFFYDQTIVNCARNGALYESDPYSPLRNKYSDYKQAALADGTSLNPALAAGDITSVSGSDGGGANVTVTVKYEFSTVTSYLGFSKVNLSKSVTMRVPPAVPD